MTTQSADIIRPGACTGQIVFVAGGSGGINLGIAQRYAELGASVALISRSQERVDAAAAEITSRGGIAMGVEADVRDSAAVLQAFEKVHAAYGDIDVVISGAAGNFLAPVIGLSTNAFRTVIDIDLIGTFNVFRSCYDFIAKPGASLIAITAGQAVRPTMFQAHACAAKAGVNLLTQTLAMEWGPAGIRVNGIAPGPIGDTEGMARLAPNPEITERLKSRIPLRDYGTKSDIADLAVFLGSANAKYISGAILDCDGGSILGDASADALAPPKRN
ncbi:SDR family oxidoreductase [Novosphingobium cyanobacteriorum]|uniref:SDR family oxidoreductase n=1 Tax=Novosphingobium cyanobacteriorum TaxID=3024215 RepID=A0ABT6CE46_9SPHN|nr:SDR family oxidoreductase [Novosphingobium cyanobacteriorum]MDF8332197.1 SDR family oxidoreductase [Novosphingobium cyanobacteriorum]